MPISINFLSNTRDVEKGSAAVAAALDGVGDSLEDIARDADRAGDKLGDEIKAGAKEAGRATETLEDKLREVAKEAARSGRKAGQELGDGVSEGARRGARAANEASDEIRDEFKSNLSEVSSSFRGDMESLGDLAQGTLGGLVSGLGPMGLAIGAAGAAGIGLVLNAFDQAGAATEAQRERVAELAAEFITAGSQGEVSMQQVVDKLKELATETDPARMSLRKIADEAGTTETAYERLAQAYSGNVDALEETIDASKRAMKQIADEGAQQENTAGLYDASTTVKLQAQGKQLEALREVQKTVEEAAEQERLWIEAGGPEMEAKAERAETYAESIQDALNDAGESWEEYQDKETGALNLEAYNANIEARVAAMENYKSNLATISESINAEALAYIESLGADAAPLLQAYADAPLDQQERTAANWAALGTAASSEYTSKLKAGIPSTVPGTTVPIYADSSHFDATMAEIRNRPQRVFVQVSASVGAGNEVW